MNHEMNKTLISILNESVKPVGERKCKNSTILLVAFGGHTALPKDGDFTVTRKNIQRIDISDKISRCTADFLYKVYTKFSK